MAKELHKYRTILQNKFLMFNGLNSDLKSWSIYEIVTKFLVSSQLQKKTWLTAKKNFSWQHTVFILFSSQINLAVHTDSSQLKLNT